MAAKRPSRPAEQHTATIGLRGPSAISEGCGAYLRCRPAHVRRAAARCDGRAGVDHANGDHLPGQLSVLRGQPHADHTADRHDRRHDEQHRAGDRHRESDLLPNRTAALEPVHPRQRSGDRRRSAARFRRYVQLDRHATTRRLLPPTRGANRLEHQPPADRVSSAAGPLRRSERQTRGRRRIASHRLLRERRRRLRRSRLLLRRGLRPLGVHPDPPGQRQLRHLPELELSDGRARPRRWIRPAN